MSALTRTLSRARSSKTVVVSGGVLLAVAVVSFLGPLVSPHDYLTTNFDNILRSPTFRGMSVFGTDILGRDLFVRSMLGVQVTLVVAIVASLVSLIIGVLYGATAGYVGGRVDSIMMRLVDTIYAMSFIFFVILLLVVFQSNFLMIFGSDFCSDIDQISEKKIVRLRH